MITTQLEHNSVLRPLYEMEEKGVELTFIQSDKKGCIDIADFEREIRENTKAIVCTHGSNLTGNLVDVGKIGDIARKNHMRSFVWMLLRQQGYFQSMYRKRISIFFVLPGTRACWDRRVLGGMYVREGVTVRPLKTGGSGVQDVRTIKNIRLRCRRLWKPEH